MRDPRQSSASHHVVRIRDTSFQLQAALDTSVPSIQDVFKEMIADEARNDLIFDDVLSALEAGRALHERRRALFGSAESSTIS